MHDKHKCFISFKTEDKKFKEKLQDLDIDMIDKSLNEKIPSNNPDYIMQKIRSEHLKDSTVTITLIGNYSAENSNENQYYIKKELQASLYGKSPESSDNPNGVLGVVLPCMYDKIYTGSHTCSVCGEEHNYVNINDNTTIKEFNYNYYLPNPHSNCAWAENDRYCVLVKWDIFIQKPNYYIEKAFQKRNNRTLLNKIKVRPS